MKKCVFFTVFMLASALIFAQAPRGGSRGDEPRFSPEEMAKRTTERMVRELKLTPEQITPVDSINLLYTKAQQVLFQAANGDREILREKFAALNQEKEKAFEKVLTKDQFERYKKKAAEMANSRRRLKSSDSTH
jgi:hypothetical protein